MNYFQFNIGDYKSHTEHLSELEDLAYRRMLDYCYLHEKHLPESIEEIARLIRMRTHSDCIAVVLLEFFTLEKDGYINKRIKSELISYHTKSAKAKESAKKRWSKNDNKDKDLHPKDIDTNALPTDSERNAKQETRNNKQETINTTAENKFSDDDLKLAEFIWQRVLLLNPNYKKPNLEKWADVIRVTRQQDNRTHKELQDVFIWANKDPFWQSNILSPEKLRKQFDNLVVKIKPVSKTESFSEIDYGQMEGTI